MTKTTRTRSVSVRAAANDARRELVSAARSAGVEVLDVPTTWGEDWIVSVTGGVRRRRHHTPDLPTAEVALTELRSQVRSEDRVDVEAAAAELRICPETGRLYRDDGKPNGRRSYLSSVLGQIASLLRYSPRYAGAYWLDRPARSRSVEFADVVTTPCNHDDRVVLRLRTPAGGTQHVYAAVSTSFRAYDPDELATDILSALSDSDSPLNSNSKARVNYRGVKTEIELISETAVGDGDLAVRISTADDTSASVVVHAAISLWSGVTLVRSREVARVIHHGKRPDRFRRAIAAGLEKAAELSGPFAGLWRDRDGVAVGTDDKSFDAAIRWICGDVWTEVDDDGKRRRKQVNRGWLRIPGVAPEVVASTITDAHRVLNSVRPEGVDEVNRSIAGLSHAVAHGALIGGWTEDQSRQLQEVAAALLWAKPETVLVWLGLRDRGTHRVADANLELDARISELRGEVAEWEKVADAASESGDTDTAEEARERAELLSVYGDTALENGKL